MGSEGESVSIMASHEVSRALMVDKVPNGTGPDRDDHEAVVLQVMVNPCQGPFLRFLGKVGEHGEGKDEIEAEFEWQARTRLDKLGEGTPDAELPGSFNY